MSKITKSSPLFYFTVLGDSETKPQLPEASFQIGTFLLITVTLKI